MRSGLVLLALAACGKMQGPPDMAPDLARCGVPTVEPGAACTSSPDCPRGSACVDRSCTLIGPCTDDCACGTGRVCDTTQQRCVPHTDTNFLCGLCDDTCTKNGGVCRDGGCATACDNKKTYCPRGYRCDIVVNQVDGFCVPALTTGCSGCGRDEDCPKGEWCNVNNRRCVPATFGPDTRLQMTAVDFVFDDGTNPPTKARNLSAILGFYAYHDPGYDPFGFGSETCGSKRSTADHNAPFPVGPMGDVGENLTLALPSKAITFGRFFDGNPAVGYSYRPVNGLQVEDFTAGRATWSAPGGFDAGAFGVVGFIPVEFTTTPQVDSVTPVTGNLTDGVTVSFAPLAEPYIGTWLEVSWNEVSGSTVLALTRVYCRGKDSSPTVTIPGSLLTSAGAPRGVGLNLIASRASVGGFTTSGVTHGRVTLGMQKIGTLTLE